MLDASGAFGRKAVTDKYGRKVKHEIKEDLSKFYDIEDDVDAGDSQAQPSQSRGAGKVAQKSKTDKKSDRSGKRGGRQAKAEKAALPSSDEEDFEQPKNKVARGTSNKKRRGSGAAAPASPAPRGRPPANKAQQRHSIDGTESLFGAPGPFPRASSWRAAPAENLLLCAHSPPRLRLSFGALMLSRHHQLQAQCDAHGCQAVVV